MISFTIDDVHGPAVTAIESCSPRHVDDRWYGLRDHRQSQDFRVKGCLYYDTCTAYMYHSVNTL